MSNNLNIKINQFTDRIASMQNSELNALTHILHHNRAILDHNGVLSALLDARNLRASNLHFAACNYASAQVFSDIAQHVHDIVHTAGHCKCKRM